MSQNRLDRLMESSTQERVKIVIVQSFAVIALLVIAAVVALNHPNIY